MGDNLDKNFRPSFQRAENSTNSMHIFHMYAVKDRLDLSAYSDSPPDSPKVDVQKLLVSKHDVECMVNDAVALISRLIILYKCAYYISMESRILVQCMDTYHSQRRNVNFHFDFEFSKEMSSKSNLVSKTYIVVFSFMCNLLLQTTAWDIASQ